jgi:RNA polymerase sigma-70 factor (ECF subfamily)
MQVIFMEIFNSLSRYDATKASFKTWITRITINQIVYQKRSRNIDYNLGDFNDLSTIDSGYTFPADWEIDQKELFNILNKMPAKYVTAFNLSVIDGYTHSEIAAQLQIPESTSRVLVYRGRLWAMEQLQTHYKDAAPHFNSSNKTA